MGKHLAIVGGGICGSLLAYELIKQGFQVSVFDKSQDQKSCSYTAAGMLAPMAELESADNGVYQLGLRSLQLWPDIIAQLKQQGLPVFFDDHGTIVLSHRQDMGSFNQFVQTLKNKLGGDFDQSCEFCSVPELESELTQLPRGLLLKNEAQVDSAQLLPALKQVIQTQGQWIDKGVDNVDAYSVDGESFDWVFDCRGLAAKSEINELYGVRGERILVHAPDVNIKHMVRLMHPRYRIYMVPREDNHYIIGATEIESADDGPISVRSALELLSAAFSVHSGFAEARIVNMKTGLRPTMLDHQPVINKKQGLTRINGLYRHGYLLAPAVIENALQTFSLKANSDNKNERGEIRESAV